jgi:hypothetical protein
MGMGIAKTHGMKKGLGLAFGALLAAAALEMGACAFREDPTDNGGGLSIFVTDSSKVHLNFDDVEKTVFEDSGEFDLDAVRKNLSDKGIDSKSVTITTLVVTYDDSTKKFLEDNADLRYNLKIFLREKSDTTAPKLALESAGPTKGDTVLTLNPSKIDFTMGKELAVDTAGFPGFVASIQDTSQHKMFVLARLTVLDKLKATGSLNLNMAVTVGGKP